MKISGDCISQNKSQKADVCLSRIKFVEDNEESEIFIRR
jgi:hypothetical protein